MSARRGVTPAVLGGLIAIGSFGGFWATRAATTGPSGADRIAVASSAVATITARLDADAQLLAVASEAIDGDPSASDDALIAALSRVETNGAALAVARTSAPADARVSVALPAKTPSFAAGFDLGGDSSIRLMLEVSRDSGESRVTVGRDPDGQSIVVEAKPLFGSVDVPADVASRRRALKGYVLLLPPRSDRLGLAAPTPNAEFVTRVLQGDSVLASAGTGAVDASPSATATATITAHGASWTVQVWSIAESSSLPALLLVVGLLLALVVAAVAARREQSVESAASEAESRAQELALVARAGPMLQQSLAFSDLFPVFVVEISDELALENVAISLMSDSGRLVRVFSLGSDGVLAEDDPSDLVAPSGAVAPNAIVTIPLMRSGRVVGALRARATRGLSAPQIDTLVAVCNLLAAAVGNARLFQDEQEMVARLRDVDRMKTTFVSSVSHELRTTVTAIEGFAGLLDADPVALDVERRTDYIERIRRNARSLGVLVEDLLDFARFERSGIAVTMIPIDLSELVPQIVDQMSSLVGDRVVNLDVTPGVVAMGDLSAVERILVNLLSNAAKYTPPDAGIDITLEREAGDAVLTVADHGTGIPEEERERVFELFYRVNDPSSRGTRGVGIGLALARQLVSQLEGTIVAGETPGGGASFRVTIPLAGGPTPKSPSLTRATN